MPEALAAYSGSLMEEKVWRIRTKCRSRYLADTQEHAGFTAGGRPGDINHVAILVNFKLPERSVTPENC